MIWMSKIENIVMNLTGCERQIANTVINTILEEDRKANSLGESEWTSVDERLPEPNEDCLLFFDNERIEIGWYHESAEVFVSGGLVSINKVTHWMPLPEAPKMKGGAE